MREDAGMLTFTYLLPSAMATLVEDVQCIESSKNLDSTDGIEHVCIMARSSSKAATGMLAGDDK